MKALVVEPGVAHSTRVEDVEEPKGEGVLLRVLEVGVCGTDREISEGLFGVAPDDAKQLVIGHESLAEVARDGHGFSKGDLVCATVRRSCGHCIACGEGAPDSCLTGDYSERGITRLDGFARELVLEEPHHLVPIPRSLGRLAVLAEPTSICTRGIRHALTIGARQPWEPKRALVTGAGAVGLLSTMLLRLEGFDVWVAPSNRRARSPTRSARTTSRPKTTDLADIGPFDLVIEGAGSAQLMLDGSDSRTKRRRVPARDRRPQGEGPDRRTRSSASTRCSRTACSSAASTPTTTTG